MLCHSKQEFNKTNFPQGYSRTEKSRLHFNTSSSVCNSVSPLLHNNVLFSATAGSAQELLPTLCTWKVTLGSVQGTMWVEGWSWVHCTQSFTTAYLSNPYENPVPTHPQTNKICFIMPSETINQNLLLYFYENIFGQDCWGLRYTPSSYSQKGRVWCLVPHAVPWAPSEVMPEHSVRSMSGVGRTKIHT